MATDSLTDQLFSSEIRAWTIFTSYLFLAAGLTATVLSSISRTRSIQISQPHVKYKVVIFAILALLSLATTWTYMFSFFAWSYRDWAAANASRRVGVDIGGWLHDTKLFTQAWSAACENTHRWWWTQQIFLFTTFWSLEIGHQGKRRNISQLWAYMLLGQVVAISFASNLSFIAALCTPSVVRAPDNQPQSDSSSLVYSTILIFSLLLSSVCTVLLPSIVNTPYFLPILTIPHLVLFLPLYLRISSGSFGLLKMSALAIAVVLQARATHELLSTPDGRVLGTLSEHPAVSSVGSDVIFCWISFGLWALLKPKN